jgi:hypothetical protein
MMPQVTSLKLSLMFMPIWQSIAFMRRHFITFGHRELIECGLTFWHFWDHEFCWESLVRSISQISWYACLYFSIIFFIPRIRFCPGQECLDQNMHHENIQWIQVMKRWPFSPTLCDCLLFCLVDTTQMPDLFLLFPMRFQIIPSRDIFASWSDPPNLFFFSRLLLSSRF